MISNIGLTEIYSKYENAKGFRREEYGTLYKMFGGKKKVPEYSMEMYWYLSSLERMQRACKVYREKLYNFEKAKFSTDEKDLDKIQEEYNTVIFDFFKRSFTSCLNYLSHCFNVKVGVKKEGVSLGYWVVLSNGYPLINSSVILTEYYVLGDIYKEINNIFIAFKGLKTGVYPLESEMRDIMNDVSFIYNHTNLVIRLPEVEVNEND